MYRFRKFTEVPPSFCENLPLHLNFRKFDIGFVGSHALIPDDIDGAMPRIGSGRKSDGECGHLPPGSAHVVLRGGLEDGAIPAEQKSFIGE